MWESVSWPPARKVPRWFVLTFWLAGTIFLLSALMYQFLAYNQLIDLKFGTLSLILFAGLYAGIWFDLTDFYKYKEPYRTLKMIIRAIIAFIVLIFPASVGLTAYLFLR
jgi:phosphoglycerol transferase MdoB-like AlkP superfamily enzyme